MCREYIVQNLRKLQFSLSDVCLYVQTRTTLVSIKTKRPYLRRFRSFWIRIICKKQMNYHNILRNSLIGSTKKLWKTGRTMRLLSCTGVRKEVCKSNKNTEVPITLTNCYRNKLNILLEQNVSHNKRLNVLLF